ERMVERPERRGLRDLPLFGRWRVLALGQPVDLVVEQQDLEVDVAAQRVDQMVAADRQCVAVPGDQPYREIRPSGGQTGGDGRSSPVDTVYPVGVHVVDEPPGASDTGDERDLVRRDPQFGEEP